MKTDAGKKLILIVGVVAIVVVLSVNILGNKKDKEGNSTVNDSKIEHISKQDLESKVDLDSVENENINKEKEEQDVNNSSIEKNTKEKELNVTDASLDKEEELSKLWFDIKEKEVKDFSLFENLMLEFLKNDKVPQVVNNNDLVLIDENSFGFNSIQTYAGDKRIYVVNVIYPVKYKQRSTMFLQVKKEDETVEAVKIEGNNTLIDVLNSLGNKVILGNKPLDSNLYSDKETVAIRVFDPDSLLLEDLKNNNITFPGIEVTVKDKTLLLTPISEDTQVYVYEEVSSEKIETSFAQLVFQVGEVQKFYNLEWTDKGLSIVLEGEYTWKNG
jgi:hypothetical protein